MRRGGTCGGPLFLTLLALLISRFATSRRFPPLSAEDATRELLALSASSRPAFTSPEYDCVWRTLAFEHAPILLPWLSASALREISDALELVAMGCNSSVAVERAIAARGPDPARELLASRTDSPSFFVSYTSGDDSAGGTSPAAPFKTIARAVGAARAARAGGLPPGRIELLNGTHYLNATIVLTSADSGLQVVAAAGATATVSGAVPVRGLVWERAPAPEGAWVAPYPLLVAPKALRVNGHRVTLARFPNSDSERDLFPVGYVKSGVWVAPVPGAVADETVNVALPAAQRDGGAGIYSNYTMGVGGNAKRYDPPQSFWASAAFQPEGRWAEMHLRSPSGLVFDSLLPHAPYANASNAVVHTWRLAHWFSWMFSVADGNATALSFPPAGPGAGGHQGGEGADVGAEWWVEGLFEELDAANEWWFDASSIPLRLFYIPNASDLVAGAPQPDVDVPTLSTFFSVIGTSAAPVVNVTFAGLVFESGAPTFMDPRGVPSGGDWALERNGVLLFEGTEGALIQDCTFSRIDGNAVFFSGYNRGAVVTRNDFRLLGQSAVALWGRADGFDGTGGEQPRGTRVVGNLARDLGSIQKQSSFFFSAVACESVVAANIVFNIPRAALNFDDGFGGGNVVESSILFNTCRESSDHAAINSWSRLPYVTTVRDGVTPSAVPAVNVIQHNLIVSNYGADGGCVDADDGSSWFDIVSNACFFGGHKTDYDGHSKRSLSNLHVHPSVYGPTCVGLSAQQLPPAGFAEAYMNNTCILSTAGEPVLRFADYVRVASPANFTQQMLVAHNTIYAPNGDAGVRPGKYLNISSFAAFSAAGYDRGSVVLSAMPSDDVVAAWARALLRGAPTKSVSPTLAPIELTIDASGGASPAPENPLFSGCHLDEGYVHAAWSLYANLIMGSAFHPEAKWNNRVENGGALSSGIDKSVEYLGLPTWRLALAGGPGPAGITNRGMGNEGLFLVAGAEYEGYVIARGDDGDAPVSLAVILRDRFLNATLATTTLTVPGGGVWANLTFSFTASGNTTCEGIAPDSDRSIDCGEVWPNPAHVCVACGGEVFVGLAPGAAGTAAAHLAFVYVQPGAALRFEGLPVRTEGVANLRAMGITAVRVGGTYAQGIYWRDWRGPIAQRPTRWFNAGDYNNIQGFGMFEMLDVLSAMDIDAVITISRNHSAEDIADLIEYCYGDESTPYGALRIVNDSHAAPFLLRGLELGNEQANENFVAQVVAAEAKAAALGVDGLFYLYPENGIPSDNVSAIEAAGVPGAKLMADVHVGWGGGLEAVEASLHGPGNVSGINCELNGLTSQFQRALEEAYDLLDFDNAPPGVSARLRGRFASFCNERSGHFTRYDQGLSYWLPNATWLAPPGQVHAMRAASLSVCTVRAPVAPAAPRRAAGTRGDDTGAQPPLPATVTWSAAASPARDAAVLRIVNTQNETVAVTVRLTNFAGVGTAVGALLDTGGDLNATNTPACPTAVAPRPLAINVGAPFELPPLSFAVITFS